MSILPKFQRPAPKDLADDRNPSTMSDSSSAGDIQEAIAAQHGERVGAEGFNKPTKRPELQNQKLPESAADFNHGPAIDPDSDFSLNGGHSGHIAGKAEIASSAPFTPAQLEANRQKHLDAAQSGPRPTVRYGK